MSVLTEYSHEVTGLLSVDLEYCLHHLHGGLVAVLLPLFALSVQHLIPCLQQID